MDSVCSSWSRLAWKASSEVYGKILEHPFIKELSAGTLPREKFMYYLGQDALYLKEFGQAMAAAASRFTDPRDREMFMRFSAENLDSEKALHDIWLNGASPASASPTCLLCSSHLWRQVTCEPPAVAAASVLPCFLVYEMTGRHIYENAGDMSGNPYRKWIELYGGGSFGDSTEKLAALCDRLASGPVPGQGSAPDSDIAGRMTEAFVTGVRLEWMFWDGAYRMEQWKI